MMKTTSSHFQSISCKMRKQIGLGTPTEIVDNMGCDYVIPVTSAAENKAGLYLKET